VRNRLTSTASVRAPRWESVAAADLARDDGRAQAVLGAPVGGVDCVGFKKKRKDGWEFDGHARRNGARRVLDRAGR
jgi:hypothetical protein